MKNKKLPLFIVLGIAVVAVGYFAITTTSHKDIAVQPASIANLAEVTKEVPPKDTAARLSVSFAQFLDWPSDVIPGLSPEIMAQGSLTSSARTRAYVQYSESSTFTGNTTVTTLIPNSYITFSPTSYRIDVPTTARLVTLAPEKEYYMRLKMQDALGSVYSRTVKVISPSNCNAEFTTNTVPYMNGGLRAGTQTIASFTVKNTCSEPMKFNKAEIGIFGLDVSNPNSSNLVTNTKIYSGSTLISSVTSEPTFNSHYYSFADDIIPANGSKTYTMKADVPANITSGEYLTTRIEIRGKTPGGQSIDGAPTTLFTNARGFSPSVMLGTRAVWSLKY